MKRTLPLLILTAALLLAGCGSAGSAPVPTLPPTRPPTAAPAETETPAPEPAETPTPEETPAAAPEPEGTDAPAPETETPEPDATPDPAAPAATAVPAGVYTWTAPEGKWTLQLRDDQLFSLIDPDGGVHTGEGWSTNPDGTVSCGPTDIADQPFSFDGGSSRWVVEGKTCHPAES